MRSAFHRSPRAAPPSAGTALGWGIGAMVLAVFFVGCLLRFDPEWFVDLAESVFPEFVEALRNEH